ncbi:MAG: SDR family NAD(P)-dependent oxidoreductase [Myxococcaceae bacterium]|nr:SDR family NAD(P)-dependent oxidoreductase [Myxococcaceae bacterium]
MKTILVTGGGRGLAKGVCRSLAAAGHRVVLTARDLAAGQATVAAAKAHRADARIEALPLDLASFASVKAFPSSLPDDVTFDVVMHVAGIMQQSPARRLSVDGVEETLAVNALAPFLLTKELWPRLARGGRVVCVSSRLHLPDSRGAPVHYDFDDPSLERGYQPDRAYKNSKLALLWFAYELARRVPKERLTVHGVCPGFVPETASASTTGALRFVMTHVMPHLPFATRLDDAIDALCFTALDPVLDATTGDFWAEKKPFASSPQSHSVDDARRFWTWAEGVTGSGPWSPMAEG